MLRIVFGILCLVGYFPGALAAEECPALPCVVIMADVSGSLDNPEGKHYLRGALASVYAQMTDTASRLDYGVEVRPWGTSLYPAVPTNDLEQMVGSVLSRIVFNGSTNTTDAIEIRWQRTTLCLLPMVVITDGKHLGVERLSQLLSTHGANKPRLLFVLLPGYSGMDDLDLAGLMMEFPTMVRIYKPGIPFEPFVLPPQQLQFLFESECDLM